MQQLVNRIALRRNDDLGRNDPRADVERARLRGPRRRVRSGASRARVGSERSPTSRRCRKSTTARARAARDPFSYFGELFGWTTVAARTLTAKDGHYGHIVLSRWPIESLGEVDLSVRSARAAQGDRRRDRRAAARASW